MSRPSPSPAPTPGSQIVDFDAIETDGLDFGDGFEIGPEAEVIRPRNDLRAKVKQKRGGDGGLDPVAAAEAALARMADSFDGWMADETLRLATLFAEAEADAFDGEALETFHRTAHDIKGQAATLGFPLAGRIAASLCRLLDAKAETGRIPRDLVEQHVQSVRAIVGEQAREQGTATARRLVERLDEVTADYLSQIGVAA
ncbi:MAG: Hpt domain-containing protein [Phyllobacteriaceae bacterium]|nr:Hpt domain-containing protein [Phyllobacteriaceae bacterium]